MPEVAEVALTAEILNKYLKKKKLLEFNIISGKYLNKKPTCYDEFIEILPLRITSVNSKGKFLWFELKGKENKKWYIWNTFGLTGMWSLFKPKYVRLSLTCENNMTAYFSDMRNFGTIIFNNDRDSLNKKLNTLGPDFLKDDFDLKGIRKCNIPVVKILMNQTKMGSGLGNYLVAEILYRARISPHRLGSDLSKRDVKKLIYWIKYVVKLSYVDNRIGYMVNLNEEAKKIKRKNYHPDVKLKEDTFQFLVYRKKEDPDGNKVKAEKIVGSGKNKRTTYWVPSVQK